MKKIILQIKIMSSLVMLLGIIHTGSTLILFPVFKKDVTISYSSLFMFVMVGISVLLTGWLQWFLAPKITENKTFLYIMKISVFYMIIMGLGAVLSMPDNPFSYVSLAIGIYELLLTALLRNSS